MAFRRYQSAIPSRRPYHFGHINVAVRIDADVVWSEEVARGRRGLTATPTGQQFTLWTKDAYSTAGGVGSRWRRTRPHAGAISQFRDKQITSSVEMDLARSRDFGPLFEELSVRRENLDAAVFAVGNEDPPPWIDCDPMRHVKLAWAAARCAPREKQLAVYCELVDSGVAVAVGDVDLTRRRQRDIRREMERRSGIANRAEVDAGGTRVGWLTTGSQRKQ